MRPRLYRRFLRAEALLTAVCAALLCARASAEVPAPIQSTVGMAIRMEQVVLPGPELEAIPNDDRNMPLVVRIAHVYPHGSAFRYDFECYGLEPGSFALTVYFRPKEASSIRGVLPFPMQ